MNSNSFMLLNDQCNLSLNWKSDSNRSRAMQAGARTSLFEDTILEEQQINDDTAMDNTFLNVHSSSILMEHFLNVRTENKMNDNTNTKILEEEELEQSFQWVSTVHNDKTTTTTTDNNNNNNNDNVDVKETMEYLFHCVTDIHETEFNQRIGKDCLSRHAVMTFRRIMNCQLFKHDDMQFLQSYLNKVEQQMELYKDDILEQSYWLLTLTTLLYCIHLMTPQTLEDETNVEILDSFKQELVKLSNTCFTSIIDGLQKELQTIEFEKIFEQQEHGQTGSDTMENVFVILNDLLPMWNEIVLLRDFVTQILDCCLRYCTCEIVNLLLEKKKYRSMEAGFRLKIVKALIEEFCDFNEFERSIWAQQQCLDILDEVSILFLTGETNNHVVGDLFAMGNKKCINKKLSCKRYMQPVDFTETNYGRYSRIWL